MDSVSDTLAGGFPHSDIRGSKLVCQLPAAFRRLQRPSSPVIAKASTTCTYSLDPIGLRTAPSRAQSRIKHAAFRRLSVLSFRTLLFETFRRNHIVVPFRNNFVDYYQIVKEQMTVTPAHRVTDQTDMAEKISAISDNLAMKNTHFRNQEISEISEDRKQIA